MASDYFAPYRRPGVDGRYRYRRVWARHGDALDAYRSHSTVCQPDILFQYFGNAVKPALHSEWDHCPDTLFSVSYFEHDMVSLARLRDARPGSPHSGSQYPHCGLVLDSNLRSSTCLVLQDCTRRSETIEKENKVIQSWSKMCAPRRRNNVFIVAGVVDASFSFKNIHPEIHSLEP